MSRSFLRKLLPLAGILIAIGGCAEANAPTGATEWTMIRRPAGASFSQQAGEGSRVIGPAGGTIQAGGHSIVFPAGAVRTPTRITMTLDAEFVGVQFAPHGLQFPAHAQPVLTLDLGGATATGPLAVAYTGTGNEILQVLPAASGGGELRTSLEHFSRYVAVAGN